MSLSDINFKLTLSMKSRTTLLFTCRVVKKKRCIFRFPRQPLGRIVACADWVKRPVTQTDNQLQGATRGTKKRFPTVGSSRIQTMPLKLFIFR